MTGSLKYTIGILYFSSKLKFPKEDVSYTPVIGDIILEMTRALKYTRGILYFSSQHKFPEEDFF